jgi:hypothetical protein
MSFREVEFTKCYLFFNQINEFYAQIEKSGDHFKVTGGYFGEVFRTLADALNFT